MPFNPTSHTAIWKKNVTLPQAPFNISVSHTELTNRPTRNYQVHGAPNWLKIKNIIFNATSKEVEFQTELIGTILNGLLPGIYTASLYLKFDAQFVGAWIIHPTVTGYTLTITVQNTVLLKLTPSTLTYSWTVGTALPQNQTIQIETETNWLVESITQTWITTNISSGVGNSQLVVSVDPTGLSPGNYTGQIYVRDSNNFLRFVDIYLTVLGVDTEEDYLYVSPASFDFVSEFEEVNTTEKDLSLDASDSWTATPSDAWIVISETSGAAGIHDLTVSVDSDELAVGVYQGSIVFTNGDIVKTVYVSLRVLEFFTSGINSDTLYFVDDRNYLSISSTADNTYLQLDTVAATGEDNIPYIQEAPYLKGVATILIGQETNNLMPLVVPPTSLVSGIRNNIVPVNIGFTAFNINKITDALTQVAQYQNLLFLKGKTPIVANKLCYIPDEITVTNKAILSLTVLATTAPDSIEITGDVTATIGASLANNLYVYNAIVNLSALGLVAGNTITIAFGDLEILVHIKANEAEENLIAFENEWGELEFFNTTGFLTRTSSITDTQTKVATEGQEHTKIVSIEYGVEYTLNTGYVYTQAEIDWLDAILKAKRKFFYENGVPTEIILTTKKLKLYATREYLNSYNFQFKRAIV